MQGSFATIIVVKKFGRNPKYDRDRIKKGTEKNGGNGKKINWKIKVQIEKGYKSPNRKGI